MRKSAGGPRVREAIAYFLWAWTPFRPMTAPDIYELVATNAFTERGLYLNLGYWERALTIDQACEAMADLVGRTAEIGPNDEIVDVGFGFAAQDVLWMELFAPRRIIGLNVTRSQVRIARERVAAIGMADRIDLRDGSATAMPLPDACCDVVTPVECAFHFNTRETFFAEAFRVLRPGGRIVLADVIRAAPDAPGLRRRIQDFSWAAFANKFAVPPQNADDRAAYARKLRTAGFADACVRSIGDQVFPGWHRALAKDPGLLRRLHFLGRLPYANRTQLRRRMRLNFQVRVLPTFLVRTMLEPAFGNSSALTDELVKRYRDMILSTGNRNAMIDRMANFEPERPDASLARIKAPTLLMWGEKDALIPVSNVNKYRKFLRDVQVVTFAALGHVPQEEAPAQSLPAARSFLDAVVAPNPA